MGFFDLFWGHALDHIVGPSDVFSGASVPGAARVSLSSVFAGTGLPSSWSHPAQHPRTSFEDEDASAVEDESFTQRIHPYTLDVETRPCRDCGTEGEVYIQLHGWHQSGELKFLKRGFAAGSRTRMVIYAKALPRVEAISLFSHTTDLWYPKRVLLTEDDGTVREYPINMPLGEPNNPKITSYQSLRTLQDEPPASRS